MHSDVWIVQSNQWNTITLRQKQTTKQKQYVDLRCKAPQNLKLILQLCSLVEKCTLRFSKKPLLQKGNVVPASCKYELFRHCDLAVDACVCHLLKDDIPAWVTFPLQLFLKRIIWHHPLTSAYRWDYFTLLLLSSFLIPKVKQKFHCYLFINMCSRRKA